MKAHKYYSNPGNASRECTPLAIPAMVQHVRQVRLRSRHDLWMGTAVDDFGGGWLRRGMAVAVDDFSEGWVWRRMGAAVDGCSNRWTVMG
jgi:hypothetical protein